MSKIALLVKNHLTYLIIFFLVIYYNLNNWSFIVANFWRIFDYFFGIQDQKWTNFFQSVGSIATAVTIFILYADIRQRNESEKKNFKMQRDNMRPYLDIKTKHAHYSKDVRTIFPVFYKLKVGEFGATKLVCDIKNGGNGGSIVVLENVGNTLATNIQLRISDSFSFKDGDYIWSKGVNITRLSFKGDAGVILKNEDFRNDKLFKKGLSEIYFELKYDLDYLDETTVPTIYKVKLVRFDTSRILEYGEYGNLKWLDQNNIPDIFKDFEGIYINGIQLLDPKNNQKIVKK